LINIKYMQKERTSVLKLHNHFPANFSPMVPKMISVINASLNISLDSPRKNIPKTTVPAAPIPVKTT